MENQFLKRVHHSGAEISTLVVVRGDLPQAKLRSQLEKTPSTFSAVQFSAYFSGAASTSNRNHRKICIGGAPFRDSRNSIEFP
jgi:hypothetical protein